MIIISERFDHPLYNHIAVRRARKAAVSQAKALGLSFSEIAAVSRAATDAAIDKLEGSHV